MKLWIVGQAKSTDGRVWEFQGVFDSQEKAIDACLNSSYFVAEATLNETIQDEYEIFPHCFYPKASESR